MARKYGFYIFLSFFLFSSYLSFAQEVTETEGKCSLKFNLPREENGEQNIKLHYIVKYLSYKTGNLPDIIIRQGEDAYMEFDMDKSCQEILQIIIEKL